MITTLRYYNTNFERFFNSTVHSDLSALYSSFLPLVREGGHILDLGAGSGRDSKFFIDNQFKVTAVDGSAKLCELSSKFIGQEVLCKTFDQIDDFEIYDGIWSCASLLHLPKKELTIVLQKCISALVPNGIFFLSFKYGDFEGFREGRYYTDLTEMSFCDLIKEYHSIEIVKLFKTEGVSSLNNNTLWLNILIRKIS